MERKAIIKKTGAEVIATEEMPATHNLLWQFDAVNIHGERTTLQCSKAINMDNWGNDPWEAASFFTLTETAPALISEAKKTGEDAWHLDKSIKMSEAIRVFNVIPLSDVELTA